MLMQKNSPNNNNKAVENDDVNVNSMDSLHSNGHFLPTRNASLAGSEGNDDKSNDACSSDDDSHEQDNCEQENQTSFIDSSNRELFKQSLKKKKKKSVKVKFAGSHDDKTGIKLKIRRTNNFNQDENHVIVDSVEQERKRHLKNKRSKSLSQDGSVKTKQEELSDDNLPHKRSKTESEDESKVSVGMNTVSKGTDVDEVSLGSCQVGTRLSLESVVLMETKSGILIVSVQWRGKTLMGALMESERFQIGSLEKDSIYKREKLMGLNRRNTRRKSKNLFGKKKRKLTTTMTDSGEPGGEDNEAGHSDTDNPYICDKGNCHMRFGDFQTLRIHIYQKHRVKSDCNSKFGPIGYIDSRLRPSLLSHMQESSLPDSANVTNLLSEERNTFSPAYSDISDANEAPVLVKEAELKPPPVATATNSQPPVNLSLCNNTAMLVAASNRILFSPTAPALQPEVSLCSNSNLCHERKLPHIANYRFGSDPALLNGFLNSTNNHKPLNGNLLSHPIDMVQDLSINSGLGHHKYTSNHHKTAQPSILNCHKQPSAHRHQSHMHGHHHQHHSNSGTTITTLNNHHNSKDNGLLIPNGVPPLSHNLPYMSFSQSVNNQSNKFSYPINHMPLYQPKY